MKIQSFVTFCKNHKRYDSSPLLHLYRYGYKEVYCYEYDKDEQSKPKKEIMELAKLWGWSNVVYRQTTHSFNQPWITIYAKN